MERARLEKVSLFIPFLYTYVSRYPRVLLFLLINVAYPTAPGILYYEYRSFSGGIATYLHDTLPIHIGWYLILYTLFFLMYEIGYIYNDNVTVRSELYAKRRLETTFGNGTLLAAFATRGVLFCLLLAYLSFVVSWEHGASFLSFTLLMLAVFMIHNSIEKLYRITTISILRGFRATMPLFAAIASSHEVAIPLLLYATSFSAYNLISYVVVNNEAFDIEIEKSRLRSLYTPWMRTVYISLGVVLLCSLASIMKYITWNVAGEFSLLCITYMALLYVIQSHSRFRDYHFS